MNHQPNNPTHGVTLEAMLIKLVEVNTWEGLAARIEIRCFRHNPSIKSSLAFLRKTPWARSKVEQMYVRQIQRENRAAEKASAAEAEAEAEAAET